MKRVLPVIVLSQFFCTSLWFAGNAVMADMIHHIRVSPAYLGYLTSAVQLGFISGTLVFALLGIADRFSPSAVFLFSAVIAAAFNLGMAIPGIDAPQILLLRFLTGFFLAGIYPVGMKIAADHYRQGLGKSLGFLVGALVLGTALPHLLKSITAGLSWLYVVYTTTALAVGGGAAIYFLVPDGPYHNPGGKWSLASFTQGFRNREFTSAALGYFGHMWELYTFWVFVPVMLSMYNQHHPAAALPVSLLSFCIIAAGSVSCVAGGYISQRLGVRRTAASALALSGICCLASPFLLLYPSAPIFLAFLFAWSMLVIADSPLFSTLIATHAPAVSKGASLTIVTSLGFFITIISIQLITALQVAAGRYTYVLLAAGPALGMLALVVGKPAKRRPQL